MSNETSLTIRENPSEISNIIQSANNMHFSALEAIGLPIYNVLSTVDERRSAIRNFPDVVEKLDDTLRGEAHYLSKFFVAVASGLFDAALNYLWNETIEQLRMRIIGVDIKYFYDVVISNDEKRKDFSSEEDLTKLSDYDLIRGAWQIDLITEIGYKHLDYIRYMRNWASAAHPNQTELTGLNLVSWLETCIQEVIAQPPSNVQIQIGKLLYNVKNELIEKAQSETISIFFTELSREKADSLIKGFWGIYLDLQAQQQTRSNINLLAPQLWHVVSEEVKFDFGTRYATLSANGENKLVKLAEQFLEIVGGLSYLPDSVKVPQIKAAIDNLIATHNATNNFYNEPAFARQLKTVLGENEVVPNALIYYYTKAIVSVFITNGNGVCWAADPIYIDMIRNFDAKQSFVALISFCEDKSIYNRLQHSLCQDKFEEMLGYIEPNITSQGVLDLLKDIKKQIKTLSRLTEKDKLYERINYFKKNTLK
ncbi:MAG: hypothetical protein LBD23_17525 [Oscillospiraceae bacterium]|nr:hypothetical protein [Oscillospiraceae bacterium]